MFLKIILLISSGRKMMILVCILLCALIQVNSSYYEFSVDSNRAPIRVYDSTPPWDFYQVYPDRNSYQPQRRAEHRSDNDVLEPENERNLALNELINKIKSRLNQDATNNRKYTYNHDSSPDWYNSLPSNQNKWVSLDAVPWSVGSVSKWHKNPSSSHPVKVTDDDINRIQPTIIYDCKHQHQQQQQQHSSNTDYHSTNHHNSHHPDSNLIVTDNRPGSEFPSDHFSPNDDNRRQEQYVANDHKFKPDSSDGQWILLSTNKGYQYPRHKKENNPSITSKRTVKMLVLPAENKDDQMLSHNGMLEVSRNKRTVEEDKLRLDNQKVSEKAMQILKSHQSGLFPASLRVSLPFTMDQNRFRRS